VTWRDDNTQTTPHVDCMQLGTTNYAVHNGVLRNNHCIQNNNKVANSQGIYTENFGGVWYVYNNLLEYNTGIPLKFKTDYQGGKIYLYSNTIIKKGVSDRHLARVAGANSVVKNNIFYRADSQQSALNFYDTLTDPTNQVDYNIYYRGGASTSIIDVNGYVVDPSLDSQWRPDSANDPPVDKGFDFSGIFSYDKDDNLRGSSWDIGAYEYGGSPPPPPFCGDNVCNGGETCGTCEQDCGPCGVLSPDADGDGCVNIAEISAYVRLWKNGQVSIQEVVSGVEQWKLGCP